MKLWMSRRLIMGDFILPCWAGNPVAYFLGAADLLTLPGLPGALFICDGADGAGLAALAGLLVLPIGILQSP
jgi:hypothetical protein